jgi:hypothetical protein
VRFAPALVIVVLGLAACGGAATPAPKSPPPAGKSVRDIDWANRTYSVPGFEGEDTYTVANGAYEWSNQEEDYVDQGYFSVAAPAYGDVTGDGADEAAIVSILNTGGTGNFSALGVYTMKGDEPVVLGCIPGGDRGDGGINGATIESGAVAVERLMSQDGDGACCPSKMQYELWRWSGSDFVEDEAARQLVDIPDGDAE